MTGSRITIPLLAALMLCIAAPPALPDHPHDHGRHEPRADRVMAKAAMSLDQAVAMAEQRYKARVVRADARQEGERKVYVLRLLNDSGRVWTVKIDAATGAVL